MPQLIKHYPDQQVGKILLDADLETLKSHLDKIQSRIASEQLSKCGTVFIEFTRYDDFTLNTCIYKNVDTDDQETIDINFSIFQ
jgi:hypothetical protein